MGLQLFSVERAPRQLPPWELILDDLGRPPARRVARALDVGLSTVYRWTQTGNAPRIACLALFWLTRWGRSQVHADATNDAILTAQLARCLEGERDDLRHALLRATDERDQLTRQLAHRGNGATACRSRTDSAPEDASAPNTLAWPALAATPAVVGAETATLPRPLADRPGSPAAQQQTARSGTRRDFARSTQPLPSDPQEAERSSPWGSSLSRHDDAIMASSPDTPPLPLLEVRQAPRSLRSRTDLEPKSSDPFRVARGLGAAAPRALAREGAPASAEPDSTRLVRRAPASGVRAAPAPQRSVTAAEDADAARSGGRDSPARGAPLELASSPTAGDRPQLDAAGHRTPHQDASAAWTAAESANTRNDSASNTNAAAYAFAALASTLTAPATPRRRSQPQ